MRDAMQRRLIESVASLAPAVAVVPTVPGLDDKGRLDAPTMLGERLRREREEAFTPRA